MVREIKRRHRREKEKKGIGEKVWNKYNVETKTKLNTLSLEFLANKKKHIFGMAF